MRVVSVKVFDVAETICKGSPTFRQRVGKLLHSENQKYFYISSGFPHRFSALIKIAYFFIGKGTALDASHDEYGIPWNDHDIDMKWHGHGFLISEKN